MEDQISALSMEVGRLLGRVEVMERENRDDNAARISDLQRHLANDKEWKTEVNQKLDKLLHDRTARRAHWAQTVGAATIVGGVFTWVVTTFWEPLWHALRGHS